MEKNKTPLIILIVFTVILSAGLIFMVAKYNRMKADSELAQSLLVDQKNKLSNDLKNMSAEYESLKTDNEGMNVKITEQQDKIQKLLKIQGSNVQKIKLYEKEMGTLRDIMKSFIVQIDSLNRLNQVLVTKNSQVKGLLDDARKSNETLSQEKDNLTSKVDQAATLSAKNISVIGLNKRDKETDNIGRITKLKACFTIRENSIAKAGTVNIFIRISRPDNLLLSTDEANVFDYQNQELAFAAKRQLEYENKDVDMCIFWVNQNNLIPGNYSLDLFSEGKLIGSTTFILKD